MHVGEEKDVKLRPEEAYGPVRKDAFQEVPKSSIPAEALKAGTPLRAQAPDGRTMVARVSEVKDKTVVVDLNHLLAGKTVVFHLKVLDVKKAEEKSEATSKAAEPPPAPDANTGVSDKPAK
jgi:FKBP-type peptidyl-prolyl cis-trans isomerase SlyD